MEMLPARLRVTRQGEGVSGLAHTVLFVLGQPWPCRLRLRLAGLWCHVEHLVLNHAYCPLLV